MAKTSMKFKATRTPKFPTVASSVEDLTLTFASTASAVYASVTWLTRVRSRALRRQAGKEGEKSYADYRCNCRYAHKNS